MPGTSIRSVTLKRSDGLSFKVLVQGTVLYMLQSDAGPELIRIERIFHPPDSEKVMLKYTRVLCSSEAIACSDRVEDLTVLIQTADGTEIATQSSGSGNLQRQLNLRMTNNKPARLSYITGGM